MNQAQLKVNKMNSGQKSQQQIPNLRPHFSMKKASEFCENMKQELGKINWTDGEDVTVYAKAVVAVTFVFGMLIFFADLLVQKFLHSLDMIFHFIFG